MTPVIVRQILRWIRRADPDFEGMTLFRFFNAAYFWHFRTTNRVRITQDMALMEMSGQVPFYLQLFIRKKVYPTILKINPVVQPKLIVQEEP